MPQDLMPFTFEANPIRTLTDAAHVTWFVAKDVADALGYQWQPHLVAHVPDEWKGSKPITTPGGTQALLCLTESGLYFFLSRSDKPKALPFQKWVAGEVLPAIRSTGSYTLPQAPVPARVPPAERYRLAVFKDAVKIAQLIGLSGNQAALSADRYVQTTLGHSILAELGATHLLADPRGRVLTPTELGQRLPRPVSAQTLNRLLESAGLQFKTTEGWEPTARANGLYEWADTGKHHGNGTPVKQLRWFPVVLDSLPRELFHEPA